MLLLSVLFLGLAVSAVAGSWRPFPGADSAAVTEHMLARDAMVKSEESRRQDQEFRLRLSPVAVRADSIVRKIRQYEIQHFWAANDTRESFAGLMFPLARPYITKTRLWAIVRRMPKGALLHAHLTAMLPYRVLLEAVLHTPGMVVSASRSLDTDEARDGASIAFSHINTTTAAGNVAITSTDYVPGTPVFVQAAASSFPGGEQAFVRYAMSKLVISPEQATHHELGVDHIWRRFETLFGTAATLLSYEPIVRTFYRQLFARLVDDGVNWVEIRAGGVRKKLIRSGEQDADPDLDVWWEVMQDEIRRFKGTEKGKRFWGARVIWSDHRGRDRALLRQSMKMALERKVKFPQLFSGYDVVSQEDRGRSLADMTPELLWFQHEAAELNVSVPFFFHAGETLGDGNATDSNLFDALLLGTRRIGHGFSLYKHPKLIEFAVANRVMVEVCPISNEVLRLATDILHHPLPALVAHGVPTSISNDDPAMLGQDAAGLSFDFYQVIQAFDNIGLAGLGALARNSLRWSHFEDQSDAEWKRDIDLAEQGPGVKAMRLREWDRQWDEYCHWVVTEYGS
ncbi:hypothetical protein L249_8866 [Ophiocordyceps polyrhachis-furcata BCC 54312]|uniref:adenosine deaminase n=1 Tax=Ophiocordyceps polyrhachis-furcata BCC 54312 TaxID=1330021 RepID=A0A367L1S5_9HYPO|nr:hypothetical protein L249_8866 [Ophiocordyceps polyrhachis-furcata BCC 54312]